MRSGQQPSADQGHSDFKKLFGKLLRNSGVLGQISLGGGLRPGGCEASVQAFKPAAGTET